MSDTALRQLALDATAGIARRVIVTTEDDAPAWRALTDNLPGIDVVTVGYVGSRLHALTGATVILDDLPAAQAAIAHAALRTAAYNRILSVRAAPSLLAEAAR